MRCVHARCQLPSAIAVSCEIHRVAFHTIPSTTVHGMCVHASCACIRARVCVCVRCVRVHARARACVWVWVNVCAAWGGKVIESSH
jgi:hypothetical protein